jgi:hypothetical protein
MDFTQMSNIWKQSQALIAAAADSCATARAVIADSASYRHRINKLWHRRRENSPPPSSIDN